MDETTLRTFLSDVTAGAISPDDAVAQLRQLPFADMGFAKIDHHRPLRQLLPEAVYGPGKTPEQCAAIVGELLAHGTGPVILTRADETRAEAAMSAHEGGLQEGTTIVWRPATPKTHRVTVITAGTGDIPIATECIATLRAQGVVPTLVTDAGVAGVHRLFASLDKLEGADIVIVVAGMEGALGSLVGGITAAPVIAVPTSVGYGASLEGVTALLSMLASCAAGLTVVGIDNGFGAACAAIRMLNMKESSI